MTICGSWFTTGCSWTASFTVLLISTWSSATGTISFGPFFLVNKNINSVSSELKGLGVSVNSTYKYDDDHEKDIIISQSISEGVEIKENEVLDLVISLGKIDKEKLKSDNINELGKVPIMMYHGIKNLKNSDSK